MANYRRHKNGSGRIFDDAEVLASFLSRDSSIHNNAKLRNSSVSDKSIIANNAQVFGGEFGRCYIHGNIIISGNTRAKSSILAGRTITSAVNLIPIILVNVVTKDQSDISGGPVITGQSLERPITIKDGAIVYGSPYLEGSFEIGGLTRIHEGKWSRAPLHFQLPHTALTECIEGKVMVDCECRPKAEWLKKGRRLGKAMGWTDEQIDQTLALIQLAF